MTLYYADEITSHIWGKPALAQVPGTDIQAHGDLKWCYPRGHGVYYVRIGTYDFHLATDHEIHVYE
jgi:hypothetical protein